jgi:hypothetical protein
MEEEFWECCAYYVLQWACRTHCLGMEIALWENIQNCDYLVVAEE